MYMRKFLKLIGAFTVLAMLLSVGMGTYSAAQSETFAIGNFENYYDESDNPSGSEIFGDVDFDSELKVKDATLIQKYVAESVVFNENQEKLADVDGDGIVSVKDASAIQKAVAELINGVPMSRVYDWDMKEKSLTVSLLKKGRAKVNLSVPESGYYYFTVEGVSDRPGFFVALQTDRGAYSSHSKLSVYLEKGSHEIDIYNDSTGDLTTNLSYYYSKEFTNFSKDTAVSVNGKPIEIKAGTKSLLLKVKGTEITNPVIIKSEGTDPKIYSVSLYDSSLSLISNNSILKADNSNIQGFLPAYEYMSDYYYVYITHKAGGSGYTLTCGSTSEILMSSAKGLSLDNEVEIHGEYIEDENSDYTLIKSCCKFTPAKTGYYKFCLTSNSIGELNYRIYEKSALQSSMSNPIYKISAASEMATFSLTDVENLQSGVDYYVVVEGKVYGKSCVNFKASASTLAEYEKIHENDPPSNNSEIAKNSSSINVGDKVFVELGSDKEIKWFKFTAKENLRVVVYSEKSDDAFLVVLDKNFNEVGRFDDIRLYGSLDFAALGEVKSGEVYYLGAGSYQGDGDFYSLSLVKELNYVPIK